MIVFFSQLVLTQVLHFFLDLYIMIGKKQFKTAAPEDFMSLAIAESE
jgi:hypothetical protein